MHWLLFIFIAFELSALAPQEHSIEVDGATLFCRTAGQGKPLIVIHGGPGLSQDYLLPQMVQLADKQFLIFYDQRASGQSTGIPETITLDTFVQDLDALRQAFHFEKISILGHSWGGFVAMQYALAHPERVDKLILSNTYPTSSQDFALFIQEWTRRAAPYQAELAALHNTPGYAEGDPAIMVPLHRLIFRIYCYDPEKANLLNLQMSATAFRNGAKVLENICQNVFEKPFNFYPQLNQLNLPTLIIHGDFDSIPPSTAQHVHENIPSSKFILIKQCGHFPYVEAPSEYFSYIRDFLK